MVFFLTSWYCIEGVEVEGKVVVLGVVVVVFIIGGFVDPLRV